MANLQLAAGRPDRVTKPLDLVKADTKRLFTQHMLASRQRVQRCRHMKGIGGGDNHRIDVGVGQHLFILSVCFGRAIGH